MTTPLYAGSLSFNTHNVTAVFFLLFFLFYVCPPKVEQVYSVYMPPLFSTFTLITELFVTATIFYVFYSGYKRNIFPAKAAFFALAYETLFNISYMVYRSVQESAEHEEEAEMTAEIALAIFHGTLSLIMFISLIAFLVLAWRNYREGINYFKEHTTLTVTFLFLWSLSILSGITFYIIEYLV